MATKASFSEGAGVLSEFGNNVGNTIVTRRDAAGNILANGGAAASGRSTVATMATKASRPRNAGSAIARVHSLASGARADVETLRTIAIFCGIGLIVSLLFATNGLDMSAGFF